jgi:hypothetical protein
MKGEGLSEQSLSDARRMWLHMPQYIRWQRCVFSVRPAPGKRKVFEQHVLDASLNAHGDGFASSNSTTESSTVRRLMPMGMAAWSTASFWALVGRRLHAWPRTSSCSDIDEKIRRRAAAGSPIDIESAPAGGRRPAIEG